MTRKDAPRVAAGGGKRVRGVIGGSFREQRPEALTRFREAMGFLEDPGPIALEVGFGYASFLLVVARAHPELRFLGLELHDRLVLRAREASGRAGLDNLFVMGGDARSLLPRLLGPGRLRQVWALFPDPWWKARHFKRRTLFTQEFVDILYSLFEPGGVLTVKTDVPSLLSQVVALLDAHPGFCVAREDRVPPPLGATTKRERRCGHEGTTFWVRRWARRQARVASLP